MTEAQRLQIGQTVRMQPQDKDGTWRKANVVNRLGNRSYLLQTDEGQTYRRNRKSIRVTSEQQMPTSQPSLDRLSSQVDRQMVLQQK